MYLTVKVHYIIPDTFIATVDVISGLVIYYTSLEDLYATLAEHIKECLNNRKQYELLNNNDFKYFYTFTNHYGDEITITPDNKLSTKQLLYLYNFDIENNSKILIECKDNESEEERLSKQFENIKRQIATTNAPIDSYYSNII